MNEQINGILDIIIEKFIFGEGDDIPTWDTCHSIAEAIHNAGYRKQSECNKCGEKTMKTIVSLQEALAKAKSEWISIEDRLPDREGTYLVYTWKGHILMCNCFDYFLDGNLQFDNYTVTHWMPLPEPPKMKGDAK